LPVLHPTMVLLCRAWNHVCWPDPQQLKGGTGEEQSRSISGEHQQLCAGPRGATRALTQLTPRSQLRANHTLPMVPWPRWGSLVRLGQGNSRVQLPAAVPGTMVLSFPDKAFQPPRFPG